MFIRITFAEYASWEKNVAEEVPLHCIEAWF